MNFCGFQKSYVLQFFMQSEYIDSGCSDLLRNKLLWDVTW